MQSGVLGQSLEIVETCSCAGAFLITPIITPIGMER